jgi:hypothetical protein
MRVAIGCALALTVAAPSIVRGQDYPRSDDDRKLDDALRKEYGDPNAPPPPPRPLERRYREPTPPPPPPPAPPAPPADARDEEDDMFLHMGVLGAHWMARLQDASVSAGRPGVHGDYVHLNGGLDDPADLKISETQLFRAWIDLGRFVSFDGGAERAWFRDSTISPRDFVFRDQQFSAGAPIDTKFEFLIADFNFAIHPFNCPLGQFDILVGARYAWSNVQFTSNGGGGVVVFAPAPPPTITVIGGGFGGPVVGPPTLPGAAAPVQGTRVNQTVEGVIPMVGLGGKIRPLHEKDVSIEVFGRARVGAWDWETWRGRDDGDWGGDGWGRRSVYYVYSAELDGGISVVLFRTIGLTAGYHFDSVHLEQSDSNGTSKRADWKAHGPYGGAFIEF